MRTGWAALVAAVWLTPSARPAHAQNPIALENGRAGDPSWRLRQSAAPGELEERSRSRRARSGRPVSIS